MKQLEGLYRLLIRVASSLQSPFLLAVRLYWGWLFAEDGWGKLHNLDKVTEFFTSLGLPAPGLNRTLPVLTDNEHCEAALLTRQLFYRFSELE